MTQTVLVTGAAGFIGSHSSIKLVERGDKVVGIDNINSYYDPQFKYDNLDILRSSLGDAFQFEKVDLRNADELEQVFQKHQITKVCHLAAQAGVRYSIDNANENVDINIQGTVNILELCKKYGVKDVVIASSSSVYGKSSVAPFSEDQMCDHPVSPYAATKRACELFGYTYAHLYKLNVTMLRFFTVYGPRGRPDMAAFKFIDKIFNGQPIDKYGDGSAVREFTYIDDIVVGVLASIDRPVPFKVVNLGGGSTHTLNEFIATIEKHTEKSALINQMGDQPGDVPLTSACQKVASEFLDFKPTISLDEGIRRTVAWYMQWREAKSGIPTPASVRANVQVDLSAAPAQKVQC